MARPGKRLSRDGMRKLRLSQAKRWTIGAHCAALERTHAEKDARKRLHQKSPTARYIKDKIDVLEQKLITGANRSEEISQHQKQLARALRPNTQRVYNLRGIANKQLIIFIVSDYWVSQGYQASKRTVERCWVEFQNLEQEIRAKMNI
ncbi:MAG: hypothetical protein VXY05_01655 [Pseudomonadota bacterium]|nr:hypothetical protein [Pseudomonadota bacterium]